MTKIIKNVIILIKKIVGSVVSQHFFILSSNNGLTGLT